MSTTANVAQSLTAQWVTVWLVSQLRAARLSLFPYVQEGGAACPIFPGAAACAEYTPCYPLPAHSWAMIPAHYPAAASGVFRMASTIWIATDCSGTSLRGCVSTSMPSTAAARPALAASTAIPEAALYAAAPSGSELVTTCSLPPSSSGASRPPKSPSPSCTRRAVTSGMLSSLSPLSASL